MGDSRPIGVSILGGAGFGAAELLRLLAFHPKVQVASVVSTSGFNKALAEIHPQLAGIYDLKVSERFDPE